MDLILDINSWLYPMELGEYPSTIFIFNMRQHQDNWTTTIIEDIISRYSRLKNYWHFSEIFWYTEIRCVSIPKKN